MRLEVCGKAQIGGGITTVLKVRQSVLRVALAESLPALDRLRVHAVLLQMPVSRGGNVDAIQG